MDDLQFVTFLYSFFFSSLFWFVCVHVHVCECVCACVYGMLETSTSVPHISQDSFPTINSEPTCFPVQDVLCIPVAECLIEATEN